MTQEEADKLKRVYWSHKSDLLFCFESASKTESGQFQYMGLDYATKYYAACAYAVSDIKPVLRTLNDLKEVEWNLMDDIFAAWKKQQTATGRLNLDDLNISEPDDLEGLFIRLSICTHLRDYLLDIGVDVYGLIEAGHAISEKEAKERGLIV